jgi:hypothetical protein
MFMLFIILSAICYFRGEPDYAMSFLTVSGLYFIGDMQE